MSMSLSVIFLGLTSVILTKASSCDNCDGNNVTCVDFECLPRCLNVTSSGECLQCRGNVFYGKQCENVCPRTCLNSTCQLNNSHVVCSEGCVKGKRGETCVVDCLASCTHCERYGHRCIGKCSNQIYYGYQCNKICPTNCKDGCDKYTWECNSCKSCYSGRDCNDTCPSTYNCAEIVGLVLVVAAFSGIIVSASILFKRWNRKRIVSDLDLDVNDVTGTRQCNAPHVCELSTSMSCLTLNNSSYVISAEDNGKPCLQLCDELLGDNSINQMMREFHKLPASDIRAAKCGLQEANFRKNRYKNVLPFDITRVSLDGDDGSDYINASYINGCRNRKRYVAAQGPTHQTVGDFWRMIWQLNTTKIVMLTNLVEDEKVKCAMYWPGYRDMEIYGNVCVECIEEETLKDFTIRTFTICKGKAVERTVRQFHYTSWPDHGVPEETESVINFHRLVMDTGTHRLGPLVIHCSAGVGRTGTFIAFDYLFELAGDGGGISVYKCVCDLRLQRMLMIQTEIQYKFLYDILVAALRQRSSAPVCVQCVMCWDKQNKTDNLEENVRVEETGLEYPTLWNCETVSENFSLLSEISDPAQHHATNLGRVERHWKSPKTSTFGKHRF